MVSLSADVTQFHLNGFSYANGFLAQRSVFLRLTPFGSHEDGVYPRAESQAADKSEHVLEMGDTADPPHVPKSIETPSVGLL